MSHQQWHSIIGCVAFFVQALKWDSNRTFLDAVNGAGDDELRQSIVKRDAPPNGRLWHASVALPSSLFISHCSPSKTWLTPLWCSMAKTESIRDDFLSQPNVSDEFMSQSDECCRRWKNYTISNLIFSAIAEISQCADETVHIFNCTKIPLKFALNKLSRNKRNFKSHLPRSLRRHDIATVFIQFFLRFIVGERVWRNIYIRNRGKFPF